MKFAILAAGEGSRLAQEGIELPKPLVRVNGEAMIDRLIRIFNNCRAEEIYIITNNLTELTQGHLRQLQEKDKTLHQRFLQVGRSSLKEERGYKLRC